MPNNEDGSSGRNETRFELGQVVITPGADNALRDAGELVSALLRRHVSGDWGDLCTEDREENELGLRENMRLMSVYTLSKTGVAVWVITEWDRSVTTLLLPDEY